jgi:hypothetical protein
LTDSEIRDIVEPIDLEISVDKLIDLLLWYGFLGIATSDEDRNFIFEAGYDFRRLEVHRSQPSETLYCVNPAFLRGLELS